MTTLTIDGMMVTEHAVRDFAARLATIDRAACARAGTEMDGEVSGEHVTALADELGMPVRELMAEPHGDDIMAWLRESYAAEASA